MIRAAASGERRSLGCDVVLGGLSHQARSRGAAGCMDRVLGVPIL